MKAIKLHIATLDAQTEAMLTQASEPLESAIVEAVKQLSFSPIKIHGQLPRKKIKAFSRSGTHTRLTNKQMTKRKRQLKRTQRQRIQAR